VVAAGLGLALGLGLGLALGLALGVGLALAVGVGVAAAVEPAIAVSDAAGLMLAGPGELAGVELLGGAVVAVAAGEIDDAAGTAPLRPLLHAVKASATVATAAVRPSRWAGAARRAALP
jgi:hypothetical protein